MISVGVDTGGTFTDSVSSDGAGGWRVYKTPTTATAPATAIFECLERQAGAQAVALIHGTTHATNALLTGQLGRVVFVTTAGFADVLAIGRQDRDELYCLEPQPPRPPQPKRRIVEVEERLDASGRVLTKLSRDEVDRVVERVRRLRPDSIAVGLLHSFREGVHERRLKRALNKLGVPVFLSSEVAPEYREYERFCTVWANAALQPIVAPALLELGEQVVSQRPGSAPVRILRSDGGTAAVDAAAANPVHLALSGPAGGLAAARSLADARGDGAVLTLDMGGTSTDVALLADGELELQPMSLGGLPLLARGLPVHSVGTGGGSIARLDSGSALAVGPQSAGAQPGPVCYGRGGDRVTVTDAHLVAGRLHPEAFLGGDFQLDASAAMSCMRKLAESLTLSPQQAAVAVLEIANADMERAVRRVSLAQGHDARDFSLYAFGGAGGLHAAWVASRLGMSRVVMPPQAGAFSAMGMLCAPARRSLVQSVLLDLPSARTRAALFSPLVDRARSELVAEGVARSRIRTRRIVELRSHGQAGEFALADGPKLLERFHAEHERRFGYRREGQPVMLVAVRVQAEGPVREPWVAQRVRKRAATAFDVRPAYLPEQGSDRSVLTNWYRREDMRPGSHLQGPAVVAEYSGTTIVPAGWTASVDRWGALVLEEQS